ncbi:suppressor of mec-8 and unc-52 protein homolog 2-like, partial [Fagus crenata]
EGGYSNDIPTTLHRSKADCPVPEEMVTVSVDGSVLDRIAKIMSYLRLGSSGKVLKKKKKERDAKVKFAAAGIEYDEEDKPSKPNGGMSKNQTEKDMEESPRNKSKTSYFAEPAYGPVQPSGLPQEWQGPVS